MLPKSSSNTKGAKVNLKNESLPKNIDIRLGGGTNRFIRNQNNQLRKKAKVYEGSSSIVQNLSSKEDQRQFEQQQKYPSRCSCCELRCQEYLHKISQQKQTIAFLKNQYKQGLNEMENRLQSCLLKQFSNKEHFKDVIELNSHKKQQQNEYKESIQRLKLLVQSNQAQYKRQKLSFKQNLSEVQQKVTKSEQKVREIKKKLQLSQNQVLKLNENLEIKTKYLNTYHQGLDDMISQYIDKVPVKIPQVVQSTNRKNTKYLPMHQSYPKPKAKSQINKQEFQINMKLAKVLSKILSYEPLEAQNQKIQQSFQKITATISQMQQIIKSETDTFQKMVRKIKKLEDIQQFKELAKGLIHLIGKFQKDSQTKEDTINQVYDKIKSLNLNIQKQRNEILEMKQEKTQWISKQNQHQKELSRLRENYEKQIDSMKNSINSPERVTKTDQSIINDHKSEKLVSKVQRNEKLFKSSIMIIGKIHQSTILPVTQKKNCSSQVQSIEFFDELQLGPNKNSTNAGLNLIDSTILVGKDVLRDQIIDLVTEFAKQSMVRSELLYKYYPEIKNMLRFFPSKDKQYAFIVLFQTKLQAIFGTFSLGMEQPTVLFGFDEMKLVSYRVQPEAEGKKIPSIRFEGNRLLLYGSNEIKLKTAQFDEVFINPTSIGPKYFGQVDWAKLVKEEHETIKLESVEIHKIEF